ncbi:MAG TPA: hypothetical protein VGG72_30150 [Bryobacteraceae bacterium]|jgi:hypothetical protein
MQLGQYQMQIVLSVIIILGAAVVALVCDFLKGNNERLRELTIELKVRREEETKRFQMLVPQVPAMASATAAAPVAAIAATIEKSAKAENKEEPIAAKRSLAAPVNKPPVKREKRSMSPELLAAIQRGERLAAAPKPDTMPDRVSADVSAIEQSPAVQHEPVVKAPIAEVVKTEAVEFAKAEVAKQAEAAQPAPAPAITAKSTGAARDWGSLLSSRRQPAEVNRPQAVVAATASPAPKSLAAEPSLPAGFQDGFVLSRLVATRQPVSGLVVSIGAGASPDASRPLLTDLRGLIQSLIGPNDFAAESGPDEFLLIYPGERGAAAQRRLSQIAEQLWDFQLRSMGSLSILFSWGGVEVRSETIDEAIASATERMQETRRSRSRVLTMEPRMDAPLRRAV